MRYKLTRDGMVVRLSDTTFIPPDPLNRDYQQYVLDVESGVTVEDADPEPELPAKIDLGNDVPTDQEYRLADAVVTLRKYLRLDSPTAEQSTAALKLLIQLILYVLKHRLGY